ncbi:MAG: hypothetical protein KAR13_04815 [Desulfobulbaceae bacterium]|nr:hypothetical protein [Desulfobulbaceae bacterium]
MFLKLNKTVCLITLSVFIYLSFPALAYSMGLSVDPSEIILNNVPVGKRISVSEFAGEKMRLVIENKSSEDFFYEINILDTTQTKIPLNQGYKDIPDTSWIIPQVNQIHILAGNTKTVGLYLKIPKDKQYENQNYQAIVEVKSKKNNLEDLFVLAVQVRMYIGTGMEVEK